MFQIQCYVQVKSQLNSRIEAQEREIKALRQNNQHVARSKQDQIQVGAYLFGLHVVCRRFTHLRSTERRTSTLRRSKAIRRRTIEGRQSNSRTCDHEKSIK